MHLKSKLPHGVLNSAKEPFLWVNPPTLGYFYIARIRLANNEVLNIVIDMYSYTISAHYP